MIDELERQQHINAMLDQLERGNVSQRRAAAQWLGEAAAGEAVDELIKAYHDDEDRGVRQAAAYALGMFRAVDKALKEGREEEVVALLHEVEDEGRLGHRAPTGKWMRRILGLTLALVLLGVLNLFVNNLRAALFPDLARDRAVVAREIQTQFIPIRNDVNTLQSQFVNVVVNGGDLDCTAFFNDPPPVAALPNLDSLVHDDLAALVERMNEVHSALLTTKTAYNDACFGASPLTREGAGEVYRGFVPTITRVGELDAALVAVIEDTPAIAPTALTPIPAATNAPPTPEPATAAPTLESTSAPATSAPIVMPTQPPVAGESGANPARHLPGLYAIVDTVTSTRGAASLLLRYWQDVQSTGSTDGCAVATPGIPENYSVLPEVDLQVSQELARAVTLINNGLSALREGWRTFQASCQTGNMVAGVENGLAFAQAADAAFQAAVPLLDRVRAQSG